MKQQTCNAVGCRALVLPRDVFCARHDAMLQDDIRKTIGRQFRPFVRRQSLEFDDTLERARYEILEYQTSGHKSPRAVEFEW